MAVYLTVAAAIRMSEKVDISFTSLVQCGLPEAEAKEKHERMLLTDAPEAEGWSGHKVSVLELSREDLLEFVLHADPRNGADGELTPN